jgi:hypothetical protein
MHRFTTTLRRPVKRQGADQYLLITLLSFAASVSFTRMFLQLTGYPKLGGNTLHIAHVLWGGLFLFIAALLPLLIANRWVYLWGAFLAGAGVGLFIDEVGKFITQNNDYFYPFAAPIVYAFFLLTVMLYLRVRRPPSRDPRAELYRAIEALEEVLEHDLDPNEKAELQERLVFVSSQTNQPELARLAADLLDYLSSDKLVLVPDRPGYIDKIRNKLTQFEDRWLDRRFVKTTLIIGLLVIGLEAIFTMFQALPIGQATTLERILASLIESGRIRNYGGLNWFAARLALEASVGLLILAAVGLILAGKEQLGIAFGYLGLLLSLTTIDLLVFYFNQFSTILIALIQLAVLLILIYYRRRFITDA